MTAARDAIVAAERAERADRQDRRRGLGRLHLWLALAALILGALAALVGTPVNPATAAAAQARAKAIYKPASGC